jgi:hypothetical protein
VNAIDGGYVMAGGAWPGSLAQQPLITVRKLVVTSDLSGAASGYRTQSIYLVTHCPTSSHVHWPPTGILSAAEARGEGHLLGPESGPLARTRLAGTMDV